MDVPASTCKYVQHDCRARAQHCYALPTVRMEQDCKHKA